MYALMLRDQDAPMDLADASLVATAETLGIRQILPWTAISTCTACMGQKHLRSFLKPIQTEIYRARNQLTVLVYCTALLR